MAYTNSTWGTVRINTTSNVTFYYNGNSTSSNVYTTSNYGGYQRPSNNRNWKHLLREEQKD